MKVLIACLVLTLPAVVLATPSWEKDVRREIEKHRTAPTAAPEIDGAAGAMAVALVGGGLALLKRSRRKRER